MNDEFIKKIVALRGDIGKRWLDELPSIIETYKKKWDIEVFLPFPLIYNYVAPAQTRDGKAVVLKISFPNNHEFAAEIEALRLFHGSVAVQLLKEDMNKGVVLLERAMPGAMLRSVTSDKKQVSIASGVIRKLHRPIPGSNASVFPTISDWAKAFERYKTKYSVTSGPIPKNLFDRAEGIFNGYIGDRKAPVLLHGDLHSDNILSSERGWLVIDPKGVLGEAEFDLGAFLRNPLYDYPSGTDYKKAETRRILQFSEELGFDKKRICNWAFACAVISLIWFLEDENTFKDIYVQNAEILLSLNI